MDRAPNSTCPHRALTQRGALTEAFRRILSRFGRLGLFFQQHHGAVYAAKMEGNLVPR